MAIMSQDIEIREGYKRTEIGVIPEDWEATSLTGLAVIQHGYGFQSQYFKPFGKYRLTTPGHFYETGGFRDVGEKQKFYEGPLPEGYLLSEGDLIVAMTEQTDGLLGSAAIVPISNTYLHNQRLGKVKILSPNLSIRFLYRVFNSNNYRAKVRETAAGTKVKHTSPSKLLEIPIPLPSTKAEQEAIATALSDIDALITSLDKLIAKKRDIKQATMQQLLTGKTRLPGFGKKLKHTYKQTEAGLIPEDWKVTTLGEVAHVKTGPFGSSLHEKDYVNDGTPIITVEHLSEQGITYVNLPMVSDDDKKRLSAYSLLTGDIVFSRVGSVDRNSLIKEEESGWLFSGRLLRIRLKVSYLYSPFLSYYFNQEATKQRIRSVAVGQTMASLNTHILKNIDIAFPPTKSEQTAIATVLSDMDAEIAALEHKREKTHMLKQGMMQELLTGKTRLV